MHSSREASTSVTVRRRDTRSSTDLACSIRWFTVTKGLADYKPESTQMNVPLFLGSPPANSGLRVVRCFWCGFGSTGRCEAHSFPWRIGNVSRPIDHLWSPSVCMREIDPVVFRPEKSPRHGPSTFPIGSPFVARAEPPWESRSQFGSWTPPPSPTALRN